MKVKGCFISITLLCMLVSCNSRSKKDNADSALQVKKTNADAFEALDSSIDFHPLPFGPTKLVTYIWPENWPANRYKEGEPLKDPNKTFSQVDNFYYELNKSKSFDLSSLKTSIVQYVNYGNDSLMIHDERQLDSGFKCKLPDFGPYECYYRYNSIHYNYDGHDFKSSNYKDLDTRYKEYGDLIFYDSKKKRAKVLNVYNTAEQGDALDLYGRYFT